jgi:hypothetical protein
MKKLVRGYRLSRSNSGNPDFYTAPDQVVGSDCGIRYGTGRQAGRQADIQTRLVIHTLPFKGGVQKSGIANNLNKFQHYYEEII